MNEIKKAQKELMQRLKRVARGLPVAVPVKVGKNAWRELRKRNGEFSFACPCEGCGRTNWFQVRRQNKKSEWRPFRPYGQDAKWTTPTMEEALKPLRMSKGLIEQILGEMTTDGKK